MGDSEISGIAVAEVWRKGEQGCGKWRALPMPPGSSSAPLLTHVSAHEQP